MSHAGAFGVGLVAFQGLPPRQKQSELREGQCYGDIYWNTGHAHREVTPDLSGAAYGAWTQLSAAVGATSTQTAYASGGLTTSDLDIAILSSHPQNDASAGPNSLSQATYIDTHELSALEQALGLQPAAHEHVMSYSQTSQIQQYGDLYPLALMEQQLGVQCDDAYPIYTPTSDHWAGQPDFSSGQIMCYPGAVNPVPHVQPVYDDTVTPVTQTSSGLVASAPTQANPQTYSPHVPLGTSSDLTASAHLHIDEVPQPSEAWAIGTPETISPTHSPQQDSTFTQAASSSATATALEDVDVDMEPVVPEPVAEKRRVRKRRKTTANVGAAVDGQEALSTPQGTDASRMGMSTVCENCKKHKIGCNIKPGQDKCPRCQKRGLECVFEKKKTPVNTNTRETLKKQLKEKDEMIEFLLNQLYNPYNSTPLSARTLRERMDGIATGDPSAQAWLSRVEDAARAPLQSSDVPEDDLASEDMDESSSSRATSESIMDDQEEGAVEEKSSRIEEASPLAQVAGLRRAQKDYAIQDMESPQSVEKSPSPKLHTQIGGDVGVANKDYFNAGPSTDVMQRRRMGQKHTQSSLISHKLLSLDDVDKLFEFYHQNINAFVPLLDPELHTPRETFARCPCLFTVVCAITSRYYPGKAGIYPVAMHFALNECSNALMHGWKCIELAQAFILLAVYSHPAKRWEEERSYLYGGLAMRIAIDLNVNIAPESKPRSERAERELLNRTRLWMICFQMDWQMAAHYGKPSSLRENKIIRSSSNFYQTSKQNLVADIHLCAYNELLRHIAGFHTAVYSDPDSRTGVRKDMNFMGLVQEYDGQLSNLEYEWKVKFAEENRFDGDPVYTFRCELLPYVVAYTRLVMYSFAFQQAFDRVLKESDRLFFTKCMDTAKSVVRIMITKLTPTGYMRFAPNGWFNFCCFSSAFLMKLLRPEFSTMLSKQDEQDILNLIKQLIKAMGSEQLSIDERHTPKLWARFLEELIAKHRGEQAGRRSKVTEKAPSKDVAQDVPLAPAPKVVVMGAEAAWPQVSLTDDTSYETWPSQPGTTHAGASGLSQGHDQYLSAMWPEGYEFTPMAGAEHTTSATIAAMDSWNNFVMPGHNWPTTPDAAAEPQVAGLWTDSTQNNNLLY